MRKQVATTWTQQTFRELSIILCFGFSRIFYFPGQKTRLEDFMLVYISICVYLTFIIRSNGNWRNNKILERASRSRRLRSAPVATAANVTTYHSCARFAVP